MVRTVDLHAVMDEVRERTFASSPTSTKTQLEPSI